MVVTATAGLALVTGLVGLLLARVDIIGITDGELLANIPADMHDRWLAAFWTHLASYAGGGLGGLLLVVWTLRLRWRLSKAPE